MERFNVESHIDELKDYKREELNYFKLFKNKEYRLGHYNNFRDGSPIYYLEDKLNETQKLELVDKFTNNSGTYMLDLIDKFIVDYNNEIIKKGSYGYGVHKGSFKSWKKKYDIRNYISDYSFSYYAFGHEYNFNEESKVANGNYDCYQGANIINDWFHGLLFELVKSEEHYYLVTDEREVKISKLKEYRNHPCLLDYIETERGTEWEKFGWSNCRDISNETLNYTLDIYEKADKEIAAIRNKYTKELRKFIKGE